MIKAFLDDRLGVTAVEYSLIVALIALAILAGFTNATDALAFLFGDSESRLQQAIHTNR